VAKRKNISVLDTKKEMLNLYNTLLISKEFKDIDKGDFYKLFNTIS
jgi:hypothetical protein